VPPDSPDRHLDTGQLTDEEMARLRQRREADASSGPVLLLIYHRDGVQTVSLQPDADLFVGRTRPADVVVRDASLSRSHARLSLAGEAVAVQDLQSTNGTWLDGERITEATVTSGQVLQFGAVAAAVLAPGKAHTSALDTHDRFGRELDAETARSQAFGRSAALLMIRGAGGAGGRFGRWLPGLEQRLRPFDRLALYSGDTVEVLLPETGEDAASEAARALLGDDPTLRCGVAVFPDHAATADQLVAAARAALRRARADAPVQVSPPAAVTAGTTTTTTTEQPVAASPVTKRLLATAERLASSVIPVLLLGETGTGKEVVARVIHDRGRRKDHPMICVNCGAIPDQLVESTLFGHEKGAFTSAGSRNRGVFESADGGTVLLDEVGELPAPAQAALLRVLESKRFTRVGSSDEIEVDVRVIAATHRDLGAMCSEGAFREDLLYRLNAMTLTVPPLRDRPDEVEPLAHRFVDLANEANGCAVRHIAPDALDLLQRYRWPGNVRELRNAIERAVVIALDDVITAADLPEQVRELHPPSPLSPATDTVEALPPADLKAELGRVEATLIRDALARADWDRKLAADLLGIPTRTLSHKMQVLGIRRGEGLG